MALVIVQTIDEGDCQYIPGFGRKRGVYITYETLNDDIEKGPDYVPHRHVLFETPAGDMVPVPRDKQWFGTIEEDGSHPIYRYVDDLNVRAVLRYTPLTLLIQHHLEELLKVGLWVNHIVVNRYLEGKDYIGRPSSHLSLRSLSPLPR